MVSKKLFSAVLATLVILSIVAGSTVAFAQTQTATINATTNATKTATSTANATTNATAAAATASATASGGFLGLPGFEALYAVAGLLVVAYLVMQRRK
jgi:PGF-CTERM protein